MKPTEWTLYTHIKLIVVFSLVSSNVETSEDLVEIFLNVWLLLRRRFQNFMFQIFTHHLRTVSYTHLDVYKRQV